MQHVVDLLRKAFPTQQGVRLRVKTTPTSARVETYGDPRIDTITDVLPHEELATWYGTLTAFVNASHAEGFGLHLLEAMACGRPLISTIFSGQTEFFDGRVGYGVPYRLVPASGPIYRGRWAEADEKSMIALLRRVFANREEAQRLGHAAARPRHLVIPRGPAQLQDDLGRLVYTRGPAGVAARLQAAQGANRQWACQADGSRTVPVLSQLPALATRGKAGRFQGERSINRVIVVQLEQVDLQDRKSTRLNSSHRT